MRLFFERLASLRPIPLILVIFPIAQLSTLSVVYGCVWIFPNVDFEFAAITGALATTACFAAVTAPIIGILQRIRETQGRMIELSKEETTSSLYAGVGHEINNPIAIVQGYLARVPEFSSKDQILREIEAISKATRHSEPSRKP